MFPLAPDQIIAQIWSSGVRGAYYDSRRGRAPLTSPAPRVWCIICV